MCGCGQLLLQAKLGSSNLARLERIRSKIDRLSKIVSTLPTEGVWITELPSLKVMAKLTLLAVVWRKFMNISWHYGKKLINYVYVWSINDPECAKIEDMVRKLSDRGKEMEKIFQ
jgi:hypothetical protein